jgi:hypothetical protein
MSATANALTLSGKALAFSGQQYLPVVPRQLSFTFRGGASPDASHVAALSCEPSPGCMTGGGGTGSSSSSANTGTYLCVVEWLERGNHHHHSESGLLHEDHQSLSKTSQVAVSSSHASITSFTALSFGEHLGGLSFPVSLSDDTVVLVSRVVDDDREVSYRKAGTILRKVGSWTASCVVQQGPHGGRIAAAHRGDADEGHIISLIDVDKDRLEYHARLAPASSGLSPFPILQLELLRPSELGDVGRGSDDSNGYSVELLALCHTVILRLRCATLLPRTTTSPQHSVLSYYPKAQSGTVQVLNAWRWSPLDPVDTFVHRGHLLFAGTSEGSIAVWDMREEEVHHPTSQFFCDVSPSALHQSHHLKRRIAGVSALVVRSDAEIVAGSSNGMVSLWSSSGSKRWRSNHGSEQPIAPQQQDALHLRSPAGVVGEALYPAAAAAASSTTGGDHTIGVDGGSHAAAAADGSSTSLYGYPAITALASSHKYLVGMDASGMLTMWQWLR